MSIHMSVHKEYWLNYESVDKSLFSLSAYESGKLVNGKDISGNENLVMPEVLDVDMPITNPDDINPIKIIENGNKFYRLSV